MKNLEKYNLYTKAGAILILLGTMSLFPENDTLLHTVLQIVFVVGCLIFIYGGRMSRKATLEENAH
jgi:intracellular septation protein A